MSKAYEKLVELINSSDLRKAELYSLNLLDEVYDSEIEKAEDLIWETFHKKRDTGLLIFFPKLKKYDGISALKKLVNEYKIPSNIHMSISSMIYENTKEIFYLKLMEKNVIKSQYNFTYIARMIQLSPCEDVYQALVRIYMKCSEEIALTSCVEGILYNKGFITDLEDSHQFVAMRKVMNILCDAPMYKRKMLIKKLEKGEFDEYKSHV